MAGTQTPHQAGELPLGRWRPDVPVNGAHHRRVGGAGATWGAVDVVKLEKRRSTRSPLKQVTSIRRDDEGPEQTTAEQNVHATFTKINMNKTHITYLLIIRLVIS